MSVLTIKDNLPIRGAIYNDNTLLVMGVYRPVEYGDDRVHAARTLIDPDPANWYQYCHPEATLVRVYKFDDAWHMSTIGKINARQCFWGSRISFGSLFEDRMLPDIFPDPLEFWESLDAAYCYYFYLETISFINPLVLHHESANGRDRLKYFGRVPLSTADFATFEFATETPTVLPLVGRVSTTDLTTAPVAAVMVHRATGKSLKRWNREYHELLVLRGNDPFVGRQYVRLYFEDSPHLIKFQEMYADQPLKLQLRRFIRLCISISHQLAGRGRRQLGSLIERMGIVDPMATQYEIATILLDRVNWNIVMRYC